jgi:hypothetical protein
MGTGQQPLRRQTGSKEQLAEQPALLIANRSDVSWFDFDYGIVSVVELRCSGYNMLRLQ